MHAHKVKEGKNLWFCLIRVSGALNTILNLRKNVCKTSSKAGSCSIFLRNSSDNFAM